ncbi:hypothetical protein SADUNF_Sadunf07G0062200 [Salix dunnii]|uniref:Uncharacterized protein n=1 Tax=Salix dunnii TaxID=1413687 RepID=A0A835JZJ4_9ROSI|nr:hypothetical protein SADUNF_Sadunf07G0062200 [Salix dunnii]
MVEADDHTNNIVYRRDCEDPNPHQQHRRPDPNPKETKVNIVYRGDSEDLNPHQQPHKHDPNPKETEVNIIYKGDSEDPNPYQQPNRPDPNTKETEFTERGGSDLQFRNRRYDKKISNRLVTNGKKTAQKKGGLKALQVLASVLLSHMGKTGAKDLLTMIAIAIKVWAKAANPFGCLTYMKSTT